MSNCFRLFSLISSCLFFLLASCAPEIEIDEASFRSSQAELANGGQNMQVLFDSGAGTASIELTSNKGWQAQFINGRATWCTLSSEVGKRGTVKLTISVEENTTYEERSASIEFVYDEVKRTIVVVQKQKDAVLVSSSKLEVPEAGGNYTIEVQHNIPFSVEVDETSKSWITILGTKALSSSKVSVQVAANEDLAKRTGRIVVKSGKGEEIVNVYQEGAAPVLVLTENNYSFSGAGGTIDLEVKSNLHYEYEIVEGKEWIREINSKGLSTHTLHFFVLGNDTYEDRTGKIRIFDKTTGMEETVTVFQEQNNAILLSPGYFELPSEGGIISFDVQSNVPYDYYVPSECKEWITEIQTKGLSAPTTYQFEVKPNDQYNDRYCFVVYIDSTTNTKSTVVILQKQKIGVTLSESEINVPFNGSHYIIIHVQSSAQVTCEIIEGTEWLYDVYEGMSMGTTYHFAALENKTDQERIGKIRFFNEDAGIEAVATIHQDQGATMLFDKNEFTVGHEEGYFTIDFKTNVEAFYWQVYQGEDWMSVVETKALSPHSIQLYIKENKSSYPRTGRMSVGSWDGAYQDLVITQNGNPDDREALMAFYEACGGENWTQNYNWGTSNPINTWYGVSLNNEGRVESIRLPYNNVTGSLPRELTQMAYLKKLDLSFSGLTDFPSILCECTNLEEIDLHECSQMKGTIPDAIGNLKNLKLLHLWRTKLAGNLPQAIYDLDCWRYAYSDIITDNKLVVDWEHHPFRAPDFSVTDVFGNSYISSELYSQNNYTVLYAPLTGEDDTNPYFNEINRLYSDYKNQTVSIFSFPVYNKWSIDSVRDYVDRNGIQWPCVEVKENNSIFGYLGLGGSQIRRSHLIVVDRSGNVVFAKFGTIYYYENSDGGGGTVWGNFDEDSRISSPGSFVALVEGGVYQSQDYSEDKKTVRLQTCTEGNGVDLVLMGDGYSDRLINDGTYMQDMEKAVQYLFSQETFNSMRHLFNITVIKAVSKNEVFDSGTESVFKTRLDSEDILRSDGISTIRKYAVQALGSEQRAKNAHILVVVNRTGGTSICYMGNQSISLVVAGNRSFGTFGVTVLHELGGHGIGHLGDEYSNYSNTASVLTPILHDYHQKWWFRNLDITNDPNKVVWSRILNDQLVGFSDVGVYEVCPGVYCPSYSSLMSGGFNFNAPSRESIYYHIHKLAYGDEWEYDFETFARYDVKLSHEWLPVYTKSSATPQVDIRSLTAPPLLLDDNL